MAPEEASAMGDKNTIFALMAQAEEMQKHAIELQQMAQNAIGTLPDAVKKAGKDIYKTSILYGVIFSLISISTAFFIVHKKVTDLHQSEQLLEDWGIELIEDKRGRFIIFPEGQKLDTKLYSIEKKTAIKLE